jgi:hypothetical protein
MMMGPEPMIRMRWRSLRAASGYCFRHEFHEVVEQVVRIVRAGRGFRVVLHAEDGLARWRKPSSVWSFRLMCVIRCRSVQRIGIDREAVVVRGDLHALVS